MPSPRAPSHLLKKLRRRVIDGQFDNQFVWDLWTYTSAEGTIPQSNVRYYVYALLKGGSTNRLFSLTQQDPGPTAALVSMGIDFDHPPYIRPIEPARDLTASVDDPVLVSWEAADVDNGGYRPTLTGVGLGVATACGQAGAGGAPRLLSAWWGDGGGGGRFPAQGAMFRQGRAGKQPELVRRGVPPAAAQGLRVGVAVGG